MKILVIGGGGREHAVVRQLYAEGGHELYCAPGNGGIGALATCVDIAATDVDAMVAFAQVKEMDLVVVTPDDPLALGMVDRLTAVGIKAFGPIQAAARIESSKAFSKALMKKYGIPTAQFRVFDEPQAAKDYIGEMGAPIVVKADGLALGKGVFVCGTEEEAEDAVDEIMVKRAFGASGSRVLIEECLFGPEASLLCFTDGKAVVPMPAAQDHKRAYDGDRGPNTGGMGAFAPTPKMTPSLLDRVMQEIVYPTVQAMAAEGCPFKGVLYFGLMLTERGPMVIEYNSRFGDPETQAILPLLKTPLSQVMLAVIEERLGEMEVAFSQESAVCVVLASGGYPGPYEKGKTIHGIQEALAEGAIVYHAGTALCKDGYATAGGRVLGVTAVEPSLEQAIHRAYEYVDLISFAGMEYRKDIGRK
ncbi:MAG: phosphoribosylamine--glycine ligase [Bacillota bacterium]|nr:MAG: phosphoribosylamine--glycine ligase [Bacillota bacterium]